MAKVLKFITTVWVHRKLLCEFLEVFVADVQKAKDDFQKVIDKHSKGE